MTPKRRNVVFFGTSEFVVPVLERLAADERFSVRAVVTPPDRPTGRKQLLTAPPVKRAAQTLGLPVFQPERIRGGEFLETMRALEPDVFVVASYGKILPQALLDLPPFGGVNVHASLLPRHRGATPVPAAIAAGDTETGATIMKMSAEMDEGPVLESVRVPIDPQDTAESLLVKIFVAGAERVPAVLEKYLDGELEPVPQDHSAATYTKILEREDGRIDWTRSALELERFVRSMRPWPEAFTIWNQNGRTLKLTIVKSAVLHPESPCDAEGRPGAVCRLVDGRMGVNCGTGSLAIERVKLEGKTETDGRAFLNGYAAIVGAKLG